MRSMKVWAVAAALLAAGAACKRSEEPAPPPPQLGGAPALPPPAMGANAPSREIPTLEALVVQDPKNRNAWVQLGNDYFDSHQPQKAIDAYGKALELQPNDPNVLTDQGVMYREVGAYDKALANFEKANQLDASHVTSLFNQGVVWAYDKKDKAKAIAIWKRVVQQDPNGPNGTKAREAMAELEAKK